MTVSVFSNLAGLRPGYAARRVLQVADHEELGVSLKEVRSRLRESGQEHATLPPFYQAADHYLSSTNLEGALTMVAEAIAPIPPSIWRQGTGVTHKSVSLAFLHQAHTALKEIATDDTLFAYEPQSDVHDLVFLVGGLGAFLEGADLKSEKEAVGMAQIISLKLQEGLIQTLAKQPLAKKKGITIPPDPFDENEVPADLTPGAMPTVEEVPEVIVVEVKQLSPIEMEKQELREKIRAICKGHGWTALELRQKQSEPNEPKWNGFNLYCDVARLYMALTANTELKGPLALSKLGLPKVAEIIEKEYLAFTE